MSESYLWEGAPECPGYPLEEEEPALTEEENTDEPTSQKIFQ
jgi:hypothetical protein